VTFACAPVRLGGKSFGSAMFGSKRLPARTELIESPLALAAATVGCWILGLPAAVWPLESVFWLLADEESEVKDD